MTNHIMALVETYVADRIELSKRRDVSLKSESYLRRLWLGR